MLKNPTGGDSMKKILRMMISLLWFTASGLAATYTVCPSGCNFTSIQAAANTAVAGDTVNVGNGTYAETITFPHSGSSGSPITFQSTNKWGAKIQLGSGVNVGLVINGSFVTVKNFEIIGASDGSNSTGIKCNTGNNCSVVGNKIHHIGTTSTSCPLGAAIEPNNGSNHFISGNYLYDISPPRTAARCNHEQGIYVSGIPSNNGIIQNNIIFACYQCYAIQFDGGAPSGWTVSNNTIFNVGAPTTASGGGLYYNCANSGALCDNNSFNNNIFMNTGGDSCIWEDTVAPGGTLGTHDHYLNNLFSNCFSGNRFLTGSLTASVNANPLFVNYTGDQTGDYHLQSSSPAIDAGTSSGAPSTDFDGNPQTLPRTISALLQAGGTNASGPNPPTGLTATIN